MNKVFRLVFIVYAAAFFSSNVFAADDYFIVMNHSHWTIDIKGTPNNYCVYWVSPYEKKIIPNSYFIWRVAYNRTLFTKCAVNSSSQDFDITFTLGNKKYSSTLTWYTTNPGVGHLRLPELPKYLDIKVTHDYGTVGGTEGPIVTFTSPKHP